MFSSSTTRSSSACAARSLAGVEVHVLRLVLPHRALVVRVFAGRERRRQPRGERGLALAPLPDDEANLSLRDEPSHRPFDLALLNL
jgi:hypothetical protein